ncbi:hypothetical protein BYT27DRAFT_7241752 [Phlegmacium glaucopus]|nr:hypothetical protein BYT27DRAFT_7241752 [Phlegmacium glaucopus]
MMNLLGSFGVQSTTRNYCLLGNSRIVIISFYYFISQSILIYRCWIVWGRMTSVTIIPLLLALTALGTSLSQILPGPISHNRCHISSLFLIFHLVDVTQCLYLAIDGLIMGLIVLKIVMVYLGVRPFMAHSGRENKFRPLVFVVFILIESGSVVFAAQLCYVFFYFSPYGGVAADAFILRIIREVPLNGIIPTIILVRDALGMSYNDVTPLSQTIESLHFAHDDTSVNSNPEVQVEELDAPGGSGAQDIVQVNRSSVE